MKKNKLKNEKKKKETAQPLTVNCYSERLSSFSIFLIIFFLKWEFNGIDFAHY